MHICTKGILYFNLHRIFYNSGCHSPNKHSETTINLTHSLLQCCHHIIDLQHHVHVFRCLVNGTATHQKRLDHSQIHHIADTTLLHVNSRIFLTRLMALTQFCHNADRMQTCILSQCVWNNLQCLRKCTSLEMNEKIE